jgi:hypothetical protein
MEYSSGGKDYISRLNHGGNSNPGYRCSGRG